MPSILKIAVSALVLVPVSVHAFDSRIIHEVTFTEATFSRGYTIANGDGDIRVIINNGTFTVPAKLTLEELGDGDIPEWQGLERVSSAYRVEIVGDALHRLHHPITFDFAVEDAAYITKIGKLDAAGTWEELGTSWKAGGTRIQAADDAMNFIVAAFQNSDVQEGIASFYGTYYKKSKSPLVAASNHFPNGERLRVTNTENGKTVTVKVVDTGAFRFPRVIDLSTPAFAVIQPTWRGLVRVRVERAGSDTTPSEISPQPEPVTPPHPGSPLPDGATPPTTAATASIVVDATTGQQLVGKHTSLPLPIASLTKVATAAVFMDTKPDLNRVVTYTTADNALCSCLKLVAGEAVRLKDLFFASLVGSANNATRALARSTGLTQEEFVQRMNDKAQALGLTNTYFVEPTGLDPRNVSTAEDLAVLGRVIPDSNGSIRRALRTGTYQFTSRNATCAPAFRTKQGTCVHTIKTTNKLFGKAPFTITAAKTGYIDEARHTFLLRAKNAQGHEVVLVFLNVYKKQDSFSQAQSLMNWTFDHYRWA